MFLVPLSRRESFLKEVRVMSRLRHENIVRLLAVCTRDEPYVMVTEYMERGDLNMYLRRFEVDIPGKPNGESDKNKVIR